MSAESNDVENELRFVKMLLADSSGRMDLLRDEIVMLEQTNAEIIAALDQVRLLLVKANSNLPTAITRVPPTKPALGSGPNKRLAERAAS